MDCPFSMSHSTTLSKAYGFHTTIGGMKQKTTPTGITATITGGGCITNGTAITGSLGSTGFSPGTIMKDSITGPPGSL